MPEEAKVYRGRLAPSPTGYLHVGHARTFGVALQRARAAGGRLILRNDDLDPGRVRPEFIQAMIEDLRWFGLDWDEGPDCGGLYAPYTQSERLGLYREAFKLLRTRGCLYPCSCSRQDVLRALQAPHVGEEEPLYPGTCREKPEDEILLNPRVNWRFRVSAGELLTFRDELCGLQRYLAGSDFGDFIVWRHDGLPSYQLACAVDDYHMGITEVVRGADLLLSTARQLLIFQTLGWPPPRYYHAPLLTDAKGVRLAKRHDSLSLRALRAQGKTPAEILETFRRADP